MAIMGVSGDANRKRVSKDARYQRKTCAFRGVGVKEESRLNVWGEAGGQISSLES
jgi:hypothetical protein